MLIHLPRDDSLSYQGGFCNLGMGRLVPFALQRRRQLPM